MIKHNEIRIGNFISIGGTITEVEGVCIWDFLVQSSKFAERHISEFEPIPLTEEWFGKEPYKVKEWFGNGSDYQPNTSKTEQRFYFIKDNIFIVFETHSYKKREEDEWIIENSIFIEFYHDAITLTKQEVHIAQNLYFALTGEELTLTAYDTKES